MTWNIEVFILVEIIYAFKGKVVKSGNSDNKSPPKSDFR